MSADAEEKQSTEKTGESTSFTEGLEDIVADVYQSGVPLEDWEARLQLATEVVTREYASDEEKKAGECFFRCGLTNQRFSVPFGGIVWLLYCDAREDLLDRPRVSPEVPEKGGTFIRRELRGKAAIERDNTRFRLHKAEIMRRASELPVQFHAE